MNISDLNVALTGNDILSIINEFISIEGLSINDINIDESVVINGNFKKWISVDFQCGIKVKSVENNMIEGEVNSFKVINLGVPSFLRKVILKYVLKSLSDKGINYESGKVYIQYKYILKDVKYIDFDIDNISFSEYKIKVSASNINISLDGALKKEVNLFIKEETEEVEGVKAEIRGKAEDYYSSGRSKIENKLPNKIKKYSDYIFILPDLATLLARLMKDTRVSIKTKLIISGAVAYILSPKDLIPDKIPFVGVVDEIAVAFFAINKVVEDVPQHVILENWQGKNNIILVVNNLIEYVSDFTGAKNVETLYKFLDDLLTV